MLPWFDPCPPIAVEVAACDDPWSDANGCCWDEDGGCVIRIHPALTDPVEILAVLCHEVCHAQVGPSWMHNGPYRTAWRRVGFTGLPRHYEASDRLLELLVAMAAELGEYPAP